MSTERLAERVHPSPITLLAPQLSVEVHEPGVSRPAALEHVMANDGGAVTAPARGLDNMPLPQVLKAERMARRLTIGPCRALECSAGESRLSARRVNRVAHEPRS